MKRKLINLRIVNKLNPFVLIHVSSHLILRKTFIDNDSFTLKFYVIGVDEIIGAKDFTHLVGKKLGYEPWAL